MLNCTSTEAARPEDASVVHIARSPRTGSPPTWRQLIEVEPRLRQLRAEARRLPCDDWPSYERLKARLDLLAGWNSPHPELAEHWDVVHRLVFDGGLH